MIDTHCHIDLYDNPLQVAKATEELGVETVAVTYLPSHYGLACQHLKCFKHIHPALGLHPLAVKDHQREIPTFLKYVRSADFVGEVGLDFSGSNKETRSAQEKSFEIVVAHIRQTSKFVTVHSRGAEDAVLSALKKGGTGPVVFHWFSGSKNQLNRILNAEHRVSINTSMISTSKWNDLIEQIPLSSILTETDGPFVKLNGLPAVPANVKSVVSWLAKKWKMTPDNACRKVNENYNQLVTDLGRCEKIEI
jgi:TatD DNase family protein